MGAPLLGEESVALNCPFDWGQLAPLADAGSIRCQNSLFASIGGALYPLEHLMR